MRGILFSICVFLAGFALLQPGWADAPEAPGVTVEVSAETECCVCGVDCESFAVGVGLAHAPDEPPAPRIAPGLLAGALPHSDAPRSPPPRG